MHYVKHFTINGVDTKQVACIELSAPPNAATAGAFGLLGIDMSSESYDLYRCVAVKGSIYEWKLVSAGLGIISATVSKAGAKTATFAYDELRLPKNYIPRVADLIFDSDSYMYQITALGSKSCEAEYTGTNFSVPVSVQSAIEANAGRIKNLEDRVDALEYWEHSCNAEGNQGDYIAVTINHNANRENILCFDIALGNDIAPSVESGDGAGYSIYRISSETTHYIGAYHYITLISKAGTCPIPVYFDTDSTNSCTFYFEGDASKVYVNPVGFDAGVKITGISAAYHDELPDAEVPEEHTVTFSAVVEADELKRIQDGLARLQHPTEGALLKTEFGTYHSRYKDYFFGDQEVDAYTDRYITLSRSGTGLSDRYNIKLTDFAKSLMGMLEGDEAQEGSVKKLVADAVATEKTRAENKESELSGGIAAEKTRAEGEESKLAQSISDEVSRAKDAEDALSKSISAEQTRAAGAETSLGKRIDDLVTGNTEANKATNDSDGNNIAESLSGLGARLDTLEGEGDGSVKKLVADSVGQLVADEVDTQVDAAVDEEMKYTHEVPLLKDFGGILAESYPNGFKDKPIKDILTELLYPYTAPVLSEFTMTPSTSIREMGTGLTVTNASIKITKKTKEIASVALYRNGVSVATLGDASAITSQGMVWSVPLTDVLDGNSTVSYHFEVTEAGANPQTIRSTTRSYTFVYPYYYGVVEQGTTITESVIRGLIKYVSTKDDREYSFTLNDQHPVMAYPKSYGLLESIIDPNGFHQSWDRSTVSVGGVDYYVYVGDATTASATFKFEHR